MSSFQANRRFLDWPCDLAEAAEHLGVGEFAVLGASGGSPYALASGCLLGDRVTRIAVVVGGGPPEATGMSETLTSTAYPANRLARRAQQGLMAAAIRLGLTRVMVDRVIGTMSEPDRVAMRRPEVRRWFTGIVRDAYAQGGRAAAHEAGLYRAPWGFRPEEVATETHLWYGGRDTWAPASVGRWLADRIPSAAFTLWPEHGHVTWALSEAVAEVIAFAAGGRTAS
jgi:pimeloyl-ACP methyl ester carboxylesterase